MLQDCSSNSDEFIAEEKMKIVSIFIFTQSLLSIFIMKKEKLQHSKGRSEGILIQCFSTGVPRRTSVPSNSSRCAAKSYNI